MKQKFIVEIKANEDDFAWSAKELLEVLEQHSSGESFSVTEVEE